MRRSRTLATAAAIVVAGMMVLTLSPPDGSDALWRETATAPANGPNFDTFNMVATDVPFPAPPWSSSGGRVSNSPRINVTNESARHSSWINVVSTKLSRFPSENNNPAANLVPRIALDYELSLGHELGIIKCELGFDNYWDVGDVGQIGVNTLYRPQDKVPFATLAPGQTRSLCPAVRLNYDTSTVEGQRAVLLNHAGRGLDITTVVNQKSESPATWASEPLTVTSEYRINMPAPTTPAPGNAVCRNTGPQQNPNPNYARGGFFWGWPDAETSDYSQGTTTPAMAGGWEILRWSLKNLRWEPFESDIDRNLRRLGAFQGDRINDDYPAHTQDGLPRDFKLRGYPFAGDKSRWVESSWILKAAPRHRAATYDAWDCKPPGDNPDAGPNYPW